MHFKTVFLSMSCNSPLYLAESAIVHKTWAEPIIEGKYPEFDFYTYMSCNELFPTPCISNHIIYVNVPDDLQHSYEKTRQALLMLEKNNITADFICRTNTATFINIPLYKEMLRKFPKDKLTGNVCQQWMPQQNGGAKHIFDIIGGNFMIIPEFAVKTIRENPVTEQNFMKFVTDGVFTNIDDFVINIVLNYYYPAMKNNFYKIELARYKTDLNNLSIQSKPLNPYDAINIYNDINSVKDKLFVQLKICNCLDEYRILEIQRMIELYENIGLKKPESK